MRLALHWLLSVSLATSVQVAHADSAVADMAGFVAMRANQAANLQDLLRSYELPAEVVKDFEQALQTRGWLTLPLPRATAEGNRVVLDVDGAKLKMDLSYADKGRILLNHRELRVSKSDSAETMIKKIEALIYVKRPVAGLFDLAIPRADAMGMASVVVLVGGVLLLLGGVLYYAKGGQGPKELLEKIQGPGNQPNGIKIQNLACENRQLKAFVYADREGKSVPYKFEYDSKRRLASIIQDGPVFHCRYSVKPSDQNSFTGAEAISGGDGAMAGQCPAVATKTVKDFDAYVPVEALNKCCSQDPSECALKIMAKVTGTKVSKDGKGLVNDDGSAYVPSEGAK